MLREISLNKKEKVKIMIKEYLLLGYDKEIGEDEIEKIIENSK